MNEGVDGHPDPPAVRLALWSLLIHLTRYRIATEPHMGERLPCATGTPPPFYRFIVMFVTMFVMFVTLCVMFVTLFVKLVTQFVIFVTLFVMFVTLSVMFVKMFVILASAKLRAEKLRIKILGNTNLLQ